MAVRRVRVDDHSRQGVAPAELATRLDPIWKDERAVWQQFGDYLTEKDRTSMRIGRGLHQTVLTRWALAHGYGDANDHVDWHKLRAAGVIP